MAQKIITSLTLRDNISDEVNFPVDDTIQSYRVTAAQFFAYLRPKFSTARTFTSNTALASTDVIVLLDPTSSSFTQDLPACNTYPTGFVITFKNIALPSNGNAVTLDGNSTELIDDEQTLVLNSYPTMDFVTLYNTGTKWLRIK